MKIARSILCMALLGMAAGAVSAQPGTGPGPRAASAAGPGTGVGMGGGPRMGRWGADFTPGWALMSGQERDEHRKRMQSAKTYEECKALQQQHHDQMVARAKERGLTKPLPTPRRDPCAGLPK